MGKLYTLDGKLLTETPEIRIGEKIYPVDSRKKTVTKIMDIMENKDIKQDKSIEQVFYLALGEKAAREIEDMDLLFPAYQALFELIVSAITGEDPARFQKQE